MPYKNKKNDYEVTPEDKNKLDADIPFLRDHQRKEMEQFDVDISDKEESNRLFNDEILETIRQKDPNDVEDDYTFFEKSSIEKYEPAFKKRNMQVSSNTKEVFVPDERMERTKISRNNPIKKLDYRTLAKRLIKMNETFIVFDNEEK